MQIYKILSFDKLSEYTFIVSNNPIRNYTLIDKDDNDVFYAEDDEEGIVFKKKIPNKFNYAEIGELKLFLDLIDHFDSNLFEHFDVFEKVTVL